jgi:hypothetical protein
VYACETDTILACVTAASRNGLIGCHFKPIRFCHWLPFGFRWHRLLAVFGSPNIVPLLFRLSICSLGLSYWPDQPSVAFEFRSGLV